MPGTSCLGPVERTRGSEQLGGGRVEAVSLIKITHAEGHMWATNVNIPESWGRHRCDSCFTDEKTEAEWLRVRKWRSWNSNQDSLT